MNKFYSMLMQFTQGTTPCRKHLLRNNSQELIDEALKLGYIEEIGKNDIGDPVYTITQSGKKIRDN